MSLREAIRRWRDATSAVELTLAARDRAASELHAADLAHAKAEQAALIARAELDDVLCAVDLARGGER